MKYCTYTETCIFYTGYCKVSVGREWTSINFVKSNGAWRACMELRVQITAVSKLTKDGDTCVSQCGEKRMLHIKSEGLGPSPRSVTISYLNFIM